MNGGMDGWKKQCKERSSRESKKGTKEARKKRRNKGRKEEAGKKWGRVEEGLKGRSQKKEGTE